MRKTKIVATIGPNSESEEMLEKLIEAGLNVARLNMSHGDYNEHLKKIIKIKKINENLGTNIAIMLDTKGPEIRLGNFENGKVLLVEGKKFTLTTKDVVGTEEVSYITYKAITKDIKEGSTILLNDGLVELNVDKIKRDSVECTIKNTGLIKSKQGVNIPGVKLSLPFMTEKDKEDIKFGVENDVDYIAASFVRRAEDVKELKKYINDLGGDKIKIISKIENQEGIDNFNSILDLSDGIMVARGDMGVEICLECLPAIQKNMIKEAITAGKIIITATQMLESMITNPRPTRAEVSDVANAIYDGTGAIMLSAETATGQYPVECIKMMDNIARNTEADIDYWNRFKKTNVSKMGAYVSTNQNQTVLDEKVEFRRQINFSVSSSAMFTGAKAIISISDHGKTPAVLSGFRPACPIYVFTANYNTYLQLSLEWGIHAIYIPYVYKFEDILKKGIDNLVFEGKLKEGDVVMLGGGTTNDHISKNYLSTQAMGAVIRI